MDNIIDRKDEIVEAIRQCIDMKLTCEGCSYYQKDFCGSSAMRDAADLIKALDAQIKAMHDAMLRGVNAMSEAEERIAELKARVPAKSAWSGSVCPVCGESTPNWYDCNFCPHCGTDMRQAVDMDDIKVEIGQMFDRAQWIEAAENVWECGQLLANFVRDKNMDGQGEQDYSDCIEDFMMAIAAMRYAAEFAADKCRFAQLGPAGG